MSSRIRTSLLSLTVIAVLIFSAIGPTIAYADDGNPPNTTTPDTIVDESHSGDNDSGECHPDKEDGKNKKNKRHKSRDKDSSECGSDAAAPDSSGAEGESSNADPAAEVPETSVSDSTEEAAAQPVEAAAPVPVVEEAAPPADPNLLAAVPENTSVTVLNAEGQPEPLATQEAADAIASTTDPIWCPQAPAGQPPTPPIPGLNNCTPSFSSFTLLLTFLAANTATYQGPGTIYVEQGTYGGGESVIDFNTYNLSNISSFDLTLQGGWDMTTNPIPSSSTSNFTVPILIGTSTPWGGSLTINNIVITGAQSGLTLYSQNNITLSNVQVTDSVVGAGAVLDAGGNVSINNSKFLRNNTAGAIINAHGATPATGNVAITDSEFSNTFNQRRQIKGLDITSTGTVSLFQVLVVGNRRVGADISAGGRVSIGGADDTHRSVFSETNGLNSGVFYGYGLRVVTPDAIDLSFVTANNNFLWGADLDAGKDVNISDSKFNANSTFSSTFIDDTGLLVTSGGAVTLNRVEAIGNRLIGAVIDAAGNVTINSSTFSDNRGDITTGTGSTYHGLGLGVVSSSGISLNDVIASGNGLTGASLDTSASLTGGGITITNSIFSNNTTRSATALLGNGLLAAGAGNVVLFNVTMDGNQVNGATIQTAANTILDSVTATNNGADGVQVTTSCAQLMGGIYSGNGQYGLNLTSSALNLITPPTFANNGAGNIFPATPPTCSLALINPNPGTVSTDPVSSVVNATDPALSLVNAASLASSANTNASNLPQAVSYIPNTGNGVNGTSLIGASLNSMFTGITRGVTSNSVVTSIFVGQYIYVYTIFTDDSSIDNLQIIIVTPALLTGVAMVGP